MPHPDPSRLSGGGGLSQGSGRPFLPGHRRRPDPQSGRTAQGAARSRSSPSTPTRSWPPCACRSRPPAAGRFGAVQSCNPPDIFWPIGLLFKLCARLPVVFDHHDLCPETFESRSLRAPGALPGLRFLERRTVRPPTTSSRPTSRTESVVIDRDGVKPDG